MDIKFSEKNGIKSDNIKKLICNMLDVLEAIGFPFENTKSDRAKEQLALSCLTLCSIEGNFISASVSQPLTPKQIIEVWNHNYSDKINPGTYDSVRDGALKQLLNYGIISKKDGVKNSSTAGYYVSQEFVNLVKSFGHEDWNQRLDAFTISLSEKRNVSKSATASCATFHNDEARFLTALRTKPFMLLAGISGTGKSRIVRKLAQATTTQQYEHEEDRWKDNRPENFELIQVKPNWHNSMDVVGFYSNISKKYEFTTFVEFIAKAWLHKEAPYFLCLDEMNLAPVEEYFAEYLSAIESRSTDKDGNYITDPIIKPFLDFDSDEEGTKTKVSDQMIAKLIGSLDTEEKRKIAEHFRKKGLTLPPNLMVIGTVNMDETTFSFSRKVLDRAMSIEMNEVDYDKFLSGESEQFPLLTDKNELLVKRPQHASEVKENIDGARIINYLKDVNTLFEGTPFQLGYRAANEAMLYVAASRDFAGDEFSIENALDEFTLMKILSRIEGDDSRLAIDDNDSRIATVDVDSITDDGEDSINLLNSLRAIVRKHLGNNTATEKKINTMYRTLRHEHFVSYWA